MNKHVLSLLCGTALTCQAGGAFAQAQLEEITVTARKQVESLMNVPVAVVAVSAQSLKNGLATDMSKMSELAPQVSIGQGGAGTGGSITIRGVSTSSSDAGLDQSVAIEMDGVPVSRAQIVSSSLFDLAGVQVLQGPQALFFGKNSPAGVISIRSVDPTDKYEGYLTAGYEFKALQRYLEGAINIPVTDTFKVRAAFRSSQMDGWMKNIAAPGVSPAPLDPTVTQPGATHHKNGEDTYAGRIGMLWTPSDDFEAKLKLEVNSQRRDSSNQNLEGFCINGTTAPTFSSIYPSAGGPLGGGIAGFGVIGAAPNVECKADQTIAQNDVPAKYAANYPNANGGHPFALSKYILADLALTKKFDKFTLTSVTGYFNQQYKSMGVSDLSYATIWSSNNDRYRLFTEELRVSSSLDGPVNGQAGVYYEQSKRPYSNAPDLYHFLNPVTQNYATVEMNSNSTGKYISAFGQLRWSITPDLELAGGARYSHDKRDTDIVNSAVGPLGASAVFNLRAAGSPLNPRYSANNVSPEATLTWHPDPRQTVYAAFKTGFKGGGISNPFLVNKSFTNTNLVFKPEKAIGFEAGYKAELLNRTLRVDLTGYRYTYKQLQLVSYDSATIGFILVNAAKSRIEGFSGSFEWLATEDLKFDGAFGFNHAKYLSFPNAPCYTAQTAAQGCIPAVPGLGAHQDLTGQPTPRAPKLTFNIGAEYKIHMGEWDTTLGVSGRHSAKYQASADNSPGGFQAAYWLLNASVRIGPADGRYELAFIGRNLTNSYYVLQTNPWTGRANNNMFFGNFNRPREAVIQLSAHF
jgi:outer membrane receptor protein involved in Fe transport